MDIKTQNTTNGIQLAKLYLALAETKDRINGEILPLCAHLAPGYTDEVAQTLELAQSAITQFFNEYRLQATENK